MKKRDFLTIRDFTASEITALLDRATEFKSGKAAGKKPLLGRSIGMLFYKTSTRTRVSFEVGIYQLGGQPLYLTQGESQLSRGEPIADTARVFSRYLNGIVIRTFEHKIAAEFAAYSSVPVINGLTDTHHPCQILADLMTIKEKKGRLKGIKIAYIGDGNNVANSLIEGAAQMDMELNIASPEGYAPAPDILDTQARINVVQDPKDAATGADVLYTDVWISMGDKDDIADKQQKFAGYQINDNLLSYAKPDCIVLHCLPAHRGQEITASVIEGPQSAVFDQAENRLHTQKAVLEMLIE
ncbi:ornithine carbamoyltransferase [Candidatus Magnetominusculus xianensis]|uniref:Ornithine carbamoyltransferase n=1 Tax=Candidatus Magnetominusculus xianensis TaxID=1748249 RepID=A0ABR5SI40_9BACT|nr:ornithine carbamoyltransferase [Candidatus Magnetominusculus xianensis]KWT90509.1 ornithine carbamoyltransferase [Candidatus Magnetominusculus xianensis]MBF0404165.1 ornithine carbamoyltransferase [Nitrospirota bacterium]